MRGAFLLGGIDRRPHALRPVVVNGKPVGEAIKEPEFFNALMKIWLGKSPADANLKEALLGTKPRNPGGES